MTGKQFTYVSKDRFASSFRISKTVCDDCGSQEQFCKTGRRSRN